MANNYFLTGEKQIGKSTIINKFLETYDGKVGGFRTVRHTDESGKISFHLLRPNGNDKPSPDNFLFYRGKRPDNVHERFDCLSHILDDYKEYDLIVMDELGPTEANAQVFKKKVIEILNSDKPVIGVLQKAESEFLDTIKKRKDTMVVEVDERNRLNINLLTIMKKLKKI